MRNPPAPVEASKVDMLHKAFYGETVSDPKVQAAAKWLAERCEELKAAGVPPPYREAYFEALEKLSTDG